MPPQCHYSATTDSTVPRQWHHSAITVPLQCLNWHYSATTVLPQCHHNATTAPPQYHYSATTLTVSAMESRLTVVERAACRCWRTWSSSMRGSSAMAPTGGVRMFTRSASSRASKASSPAALTAPPAAEEREGTDYKRPKNQLILFLKS